LVAHLAAERLPVDLAALYGRETRCVGHRESAARAAKEIAIPVGRKAEREDNPSPDPLPGLEAAPAAPAPQPGFAERGLNPAPPSLLGKGVGGLGSSVPHFTPAITAAIESTANVQVLTMRAQEAFLRVNGRFTEAAAGLIRFQTSLLEKWPRTRGEPGASA